MARDEEVEDGAVDDVLAAIVVASYAYQDSVLLCNISESFWILHIHLTFLKFTIINRRLETTIVHVSAAYTMPIEQIAYAASMP